MIVVADSGPIIHLSMVGRFELLHDLFGEILVPRTVYREVVEAGSGLPGSGELASASWALVADAQVEAPVARLLQTHLDPGEVAAITLAIERGAGRILIDDMAARHAANRLGLFVIGTLGILVAAKRRGVVDTVAPLLDSLKQQGFWISAAIEQVVLRSCGEHPLD